MRSMKSLMSMSLGHTDIISRWSSGVTHKDFGYLRDLAVVCIFNRLVQYDVFDLRVVE